MAGLRISDLTIEYTRGGYVVRPIEGLNFDCGDGELVILLGPSGSGKTTLLSCLAGLLTPAAGTIEVGGTKLGSLGAHELTEYRRHGVGVVFQAFNLIPSLTARENVAVPMRLAGKSRKAANERAEVLLARVGLSERADHRPAQLSGGQQQRVAIARALAQNPPLIVADEPTAHLDYVQVEEVLQLIRGLAAPGRLVVVATHDQRFTPIGDRVIDLSPPHVEDAASRRVTLVPGEVLFEQGDRADLVYVIDVGAVEVYRERAEGGEDVLTRLVAGEYVGELGPLLGLPRSASVRAVEETRLIGYGAREFAELAGSRQRRFTRPTPGAVAPAPDVPARGSTRA